MPRTRSIRPGFFTNDTLGAMRPVVRLLFAGLWTIADREGRLEDRPLKIQAAVLPYDHINVDKSLDELVETGFIARYEHAGARCIQIHNWRKHQHPHPREDASVLPAPDGFQAGPEAGPRYDPEPAPGHDPEPDLGQTPARLVASSSSSSSPSRNSLREDPPTPQGGRPRGRRRNGGVVFDDSGPQYEQRVGADGKREWVPVEA